MLLDFLIPPECLLCGTTLPQAADCICPLCAAGLQRSGHHRQPDNMMVGRFAGRFPFRHAAAHFLYSPDAAIATLIHHMKYHGMQSIALRLGRIIGEELRLTQMLQGVDAIIPVPMHWRKRMLRGYNQAEVLARGISQSTGLPLSNELRALRTHKSQTRVDRLTRLHNVDGIFRLRHPERVDGLHLLLIDDVCTTGATLTSCATSILADAPHATISILTLAATT